jgi:hypothetical protein
VIISRLTDRICRLLGEDWVAKKKCLEGTVKCDLIDYIMKRFSWSLIAPHTPEKVNQLEHIYKILNKYCYYSIELMGMCFQSNLVEYIDQTLNVILQHNPLARENTKYSGLLYEIISLINSTIALRTTPNNLVYKLDFLVQDLFYA